MTVYLLSLQLVELEPFRHEILEFPQETREDLLSLIDRFLKGERLSPREFKIFKIDQKHKVLEFKVKDSRGNWRAIAVKIQRKYLVFVYAFHKKSQKLLENDKQLIRSRIRRIRI
jgi:phage-related protein